MQSWFSDLRHALRVFRTSPLFAITAVAAIALGIGATTAIFSVVNAVVLKPVPYPEPDRVVQLQIERDDVVFGLNTSPAKFMLWRELDDVFADVAGFQTTALNLTQGDEPELVQAARVSEGYFRVFGAPLESGRTFTPEGDLPNAVPTVVLSHAFWTKRFAGDPAIVGRSISLSGAPYTVIGVAGEGFDVREFADPDVWVAMRLDPATADQSHYFRAVARLAPGVTLEQARVRLQAAVATFHERYPAALPATESWTAVTLQQAIVGNTGRTLMESIASVATSRERFNMLLMSIFGGTALLLAALGIYSLLAYAVQQRTHELGVRIALGAEPGRIRAMVLRQGGVLLAAGVAGGLVAAFYLSSLLASFLFGVEPRDGVAFTAVPAALTLIGLAIVAVVAFRAGRVDPLEALRHD